MSDNFRPIFIVGVGRSGTSLLQSMLNAHSMIAFPSETHFIRNYIAKGKSWSESKVEVLKDEFLQNLQLDLKSIARNSEGVVEFYENMMQAYLQKKSKNYIGDKDPKNIENLKLIKKHFPNALVVHIYRDPRAVIASRLKAKWSKDNPLWQHILAYKAQFEYMQQQKQIFGRDVVEIKYEELLNNPKQNLQTVLDKLELEFEDGMLEFFKSADDVVKGEEKSWKENLYKPVMSENIDKYKTELDSAIILKIEKALYPQMKQCGYEYNKSSLFMSCMYAVLGRVYCMRSCN